MNVPQPEMRADTVLSLAVWWGLAAVDFVKRGQAHNAANSASNAAHFGRIALEGGARI